MRSSLLTSTYSAKLLTASAALHDGMNARIQSTSSVRAIHRHHRRDVVCRKDQLMLVGENSSNRNGRADLDADRTGPPSSFRTAFTCADVLNIDSGIFSGTKEQSQIWMTLTSDRRRARPQGSNSCLCITAQSLQQASRSSGPSSFRETDSLNEAFASSPARSHQQLTLRP